MHLFKKPYIFWIFGIFLLYLILSIWISGFYNTIPLLIIYAQSVNWFKIGLSLLLTFLIGFFVAVNSVLIYIKNKERKICKGVASTSVGAVGGLIVGVCPLCITGLVPLVLGILGISFSFASLPFEGIEIQLLIVIILFISYLSLNRQ